LLYQSKRMAPKKPTKKDAKSESDASASEEEVKPKKAAAKKPFFRPTMADAWCFCPG